MTAREGRLLRLTARGILLASLAACGDGGPSSGNLTGAFGDLALDPDDSFVDRVRRETCAEVDHGVFHFAFGEGAVRLQGSIPWANIGGMVAYTHATYPLPPTPLETQVRSWELLAPVEHAEMTDGTFTITNQPPRKQGSFTMNLADGTRVDGEFDLRKRQTTGPDIDCGSGGGGFEDLDD